MTVDSTVNRTTFAGNGVTTAFATSFPFLSSSDLVVLERNDTTGVETPKTLTTHYTVSGGSGSTGTVTMLTAPAALVTLVVYRDPPMTQLVDIVDNDPLPSASIEQPLDKLTMAEQRTREIAERGLRLPDGDTGFTADDMKLPPKVDRASMLLAFDADGKPIASAGTGGAATSAFMATVLDDATAAAARTTLGAQAIDDELTALAGLTSAADKVPYFTGSGTAAVADLSAAGRALIDDADAAAQRATLAAAGTGVVNTFTQEQLMTDGAVVSGTISEVAGVGSTAVGLEVQGAADAGFSIYRTAAANTTDECYTAHFAKDAGGTVRKVHSLSSKWGDTNATNGYSIIRYNAPYLAAGAQTDDLSIRQFGGLGVVIGGNNDSDLPASTIAGVKFMTRYNTYIGAVLYVSGQITFPATANPSADANTLDDYEEGTATVTAACGTSGTITLNSGANGDVLHYTKIGQMVFVHGFISVASVSAPVGTLTINGLPFTVGQRTAVTVQADSLAAGATTSIVARAAESGTAIRISKYAAGAAAALAGDVQAGSEFYISMQFRI